MFPLALAKNKEVHEREKRGYFRCTTEIYIELSQQAMRTIAPKQEPRQCKIMAAFELTTATASPSIIISKTW